MIIKFLSLPLLWMLLVFFFVFTNKSSHAEEKNLSTPTQDSVSTENISSTKDLLSLRDPFQKPLLQMKKKIIKNDLERYPLDQIKLVGIISGLKKIRAMVRVPSGKSFFVGVNDKIGLRAGSITKIDEESIDVVETIVDALGNQEVYRTTKRLKPVISKKIGINEKVVTGYGDDTEAANLETELEEAPETDLSKDE